MSAEFRAGRSFVSFIPGGRAVALLILTASLAACGGGGGSSTGNATASSSTASPSTGSSAPTTPTVNAAPTISGSPATAASVGQPYSFTPSASDPEGATLTFTITGTPSWATFNAATGKLSGTAVAGTYPNISISVSDGTNATALPSFSITVSGGVAATGSATLSWTPPTTNVDGSTLSTLAGYKIYYGTDQSNLGKVVSISNTGLTAYTIDGLTAGTYYFTITAVDTSGGESSFSNMASKTI
jgi:Putative Ig domain